jgi:hypothetical protein
VGFVSGSIRYCSGCGRSTVGCTCRGDRRQPKVAGQRESLGI